MAGQLTIDTLKASSGVLATQNGMTGVGKAWVNFNGSTAAIRSSFNVSSVSRTATGVWTVSFTTAMPDANYSCVATGRQAAVGNGYSLGVDNPATTSVGITGTTSAGSADTAYVMVAVLGN